MPDNDRVNARARVVRCVLLVCAWTASATLAGTPRWVAFGPGYGSSRVVQGAGGVVFAEAAHRLYVSADQGASWQPVGPLPESLLGALGDASVLFSGGESGLFRSVDGGRSWTRTFDRLVHRAAFGTRVSYLSDYTNLHRSTDAGRTWQRVVEAHVPTWGAVIDPRHDEQVAYAASGETVLKTIDGGATWSPVLDAHGTGALQLALSPSAPDTVYATDGGGLYRTDDGGALWSRRPPRIPEQLLVAPLDPSRLFAVLGGGGIEVSPDGGATWAPVTGLPPLESGPSLDVTGAASPTLWLSDGRLFRSADDGLTWERPLGRGLPAPLQALRFSAGTSPAIFLATVGLFRSDDGGRSWIEVSAALGDLHLADVQTGSAVGRVFALGAHALSTSGDSGRTWRQLVARGGTSLAVIGSKTLVIGGNGIATSADGGRTWAQTLSAVVFDDGSDHAFRVVDRLIQEGGALCALSRVLPNRGASWHELHCSTDRGGHWRRIAQGQEGSFVLAVGADGSMYLVRQRTDVQGTQLLRSADRGRHWLEVHRFEHGIADLAGDPADARRLYTATPDGVLVSDDRGQQWRAFPRAGLARAGALEVRRVLVGPDGRTLYAAAFGGGIFAFTVPRP